MRARIEIARRASEGRVAAYVLALASSCAALAVSLALVSGGGDDSIPGLLFLGAVGLVGWHGGLGPALLTTACGALALDYFFEIPPYRLEVTNSRTRTYLLSFLLMSVRAAEARST